MRARRVRSGWSKREAHGNDDRSGNDRGLPRHAFARRHHGAPFSASNQDKPALLFITAF
jgi:hypothetical protein